VAARPRQRGLPRRRLVRIFLFDYPTTSELPTCHSDCFRAVVSSSRPRYPICDHESDQRRSSACRREQPLDYQSDGFSAAQRNAQHRSARRPDSMITSFFVTG
jgi:hypothetical protein